MRYGVLPGIQWLKEIDADFTLGSLELVRRMKSQGYARHFVEQRRRWLEEKTGCRLVHVGAHSIPGDEMRGNIENPLGAVQMPLGVAGPLRINGINAKGVFY